MCVFHATVCVCSTRSFSYSSYCCCSWCFQFRYPAAHEKSSQTNAFEFPFEMWFPIGELDWPTLAHQSVTESNWLCLARVQNESISEEVTHTFGHGRLYFLKILCDIAQHTIGMIVDTVEFCDNSHQFFFNSFTCFHCDIAHAHSVYWHPSADFHSELKFSISVFPPLSLEWFISFIRNSEFGSNLDVLSKNKKKNQKKHGTDWNVFVWDSFVSNHAPEREQKKWKSNKNTTQQWLRLDVSMHREHTVWQVSVCACWMHILCAPDRFDNICVLLCFELRQHTARHTIFGTCARNDFFDYRELDESPPTTRRCRLFDNCANYYVVEKAITITSRILHIPSKCVWQTESVFKSLHKFFCF